MNEAKRKWRKTAQHTKFAVYFISVLSALSTWMWFHSALHLPLFSLNFGSTIPIHWQLKITSTISKASLYIQYDRVFCSVSMVFALLAATPRLKVEINCCSYCQTLPKWYVQLVRYFYFNRFDTDTCRTLFATNFLFEVFLCSNGNWHENINTKSINNSIRLLEFFPTVR